MTASYGERGDFTLIPVVALESDGVIAREGIKASAKEKYAFRRTWLQSKGNLENFVLFAVKGDSMDPTITNGDFENGAGAIRSTGPNCALTDWRESGVS